MKHKHLAVVGAIGLFVAISGCYLLQLSGTPHPLLTNSLFLIPPALAVISGLYALSIYRLSSPHGQAIGLITAGLACWFIGESIFYSFQFIFHTNPFPSLADVFYVAAYPLLLAGLVKEVATHGSNWRSLRDSDKLVVILGGFLLLTLGFIVSYFSIFLAYQSSEPLLNNVVALGYGAGDLILLVPILLILKLVLGFRGGALFYSWTLILAAILCIMAGDVLFAIYNTQYAALEPAYSLIDLTWTAGYLLFAYSFFFTAQTIKELQLKLAKPRKAQT